jgi:hypothetical protein
VVHVRRATSRWEPTRNPPRGPMILLLVSALVIGGCSREGSEKSATETGTPSPNRPAESEAAGRPTPSPAPEAPPSAGLSTPTPSAPVRPETEPRVEKPEPRPVVAAPPAAEAGKEEPKPDPVTEAAPQESVRTESKKVVASDVMVLTGSALGGVRLEHKLHVERGGGTCATCHHASRPEKPASAPQQACSDCHAKVATAPMRTRYQAAFHNPSAQSGTCVDCHKSENATGKKAPVKCADCHKK